MKKKLIIIGLLSCGMSLIYGEEIAYVPQVANAGAAENDGGAGVAWPDGQNENPDRFTAGSGTIADCVTDNLTGLMWPENANLNNGTMNWATAVTYFDPATADGPNNTKLCGYADWRLPTVNELKSLVNYGDAINPANYLNDDFSNVQVNSYWSSTVLASDPGGNAWRVDMGIGDVSPLGLLNAYYVWPVRGGQ